MTYRETLNKAKLYEIEVLKLSVAFEVHCTFDGEELELTEEQFEKACYLVERAYLKSEYLAIDSIARALINMLEYIQLEEVDIWKLIEKASYYN